MGYISDLFFCKCLEGVKKRSEVEDEGGEEEEGESSGLFFKLQILEFATNCFSEINRLGHGGFGPVFWGLLPKGEEIAVKKLSMNSRQGVREFTNEVKLLLKIQHKNLVRLLGCCVEGPEKMLVYEYLPNKSLDNFLFDEDKRAMLDWRKRYDIIIGVARGLLYLHEESPERIIHRDIKASNILLDGDLKPKISDFGLARLFPWDDTHVSTFKIAGTHGYMAPEYAMHGYLSAKTDVFSYGILVLEIVSGRKNYVGTLDEEKADLLSYTWKLWEEGKALKLVDPSLGTTMVKRDEAAMCIQLGLLCCQASVAERPDMNSVHLTLLSDSFTIPKPGKPGIQGRRGHWGTSTSTGRWGTSTSTAPMTNSITNDHTNSTASTSAAANNPNYSYTSSIDDLAR